MNPIGRAAMGDRDGSGARLATDRHAGFRFATSCGLRLSECGDATAGRGMTLTAILLPQAPMVAQSRGRGRGLHIRERPSTGEQQDQRRRGHSRAAVSETRDWLVNLSRRQIASGDRIVRLYEQLVDDLSKLVAELEFDPQRSPLSMWNVPSSAGSLRIPDR